jgi:low affinity Fe/Cu permease
MKNHNNFSTYFDAFSTKVTKLAGSPAAFITAFAIIIVWGITGPMFHFSDTWQLVINTGTTVVTFLMVFVIQQTQNKDTMALHLKLNELIAAHQGASNRLIDIEDLTENELQTLKKFYIELAELSKKDTDIGCTHSIDEAKENHLQKTPTPKKENLKQKKQ